MTTFDKIKHYLKSLTRDEKKEVRRRLKEEGGGGSDEIIVDVMCCAELIGTFNGNNFLSYTNNETPIEHYCWLCVLPYLDNYTADSVIEVRTYMTNEVVPSALIHNTVIEDSPIFHDNEQVAYDGSNYLREETLLEDSHSVLVETEEEENIYIKVKYTKDS